MESDHKNVDVQGHFLADFVYDVISDFAPEELPVLTALLRFDDEEIGRRLARGSKRDAPLGFVMGEIVALATPVVWVAVQQVADRVSGTAVDGVLARARVLMRRRKVPTAPLPRFGSPELREIRETVVDLAVRSGMKQARTERLADEVVGRLALGGADDQDA